MLIAPNTLWKHNRVQSTIWWEVDQLIICKINRVILGFHSRDQQLCFSMKTKEDVSIIIAFNSRRIGSGHQHGRHFIVWGHQHGGRDVMWNPRIETKQNNASQEYQGNLPLLRPGTYNSFSILVREVKVRLWEWDFTIFSWKCINCHIRNVKFNKSEGLCIMSSEIGLSTKIEFFFPKSFSVFKSNLYANKTPVFKWNPFFFFFFLQFWM